MNRLEGSALWCGQGRRRVFNFNLFNRSTYGRSMVLCSIIIIIIIGAVLRQQDVHSVLSLQYSTVLCFCSFSGFIAAKWN